MKILVINTGSSSIKYQLFDMEACRSLASGLVERIGEPAGLITHAASSVNDVPVTKVEETVIADHHTGMMRIVDLLVDPHHGVIRDKSEISGLGHRVVHGGETFHAPRLIGQEVLAAIRDHIPLAPLHNPANLMGIEVGQAVFPAAPQVAVFDTAFHQTIPPEAFLYALPFELYSRHRVRRYGFHGTSHAYVAERAAAFLGKPLRELNLVTLHLGNGASMAAIRHGVCVDTTMGMTPLEGLVMGTRSGDIDPALPFFLADHLGMSFTDIDALLNKESGLKGMCGTNDMREVLEKEASKDPQARAALEVYTYRIRKYLGAYYAVAGPLAAVVFTAGIGEHSPAIRERCCRGLAHLGLELDEGRNTEPGNEVRDISVPRGAVRILVVPTNEELKIAEETMKVLTAAEPAAQASTSCS